MSSAGNDDGRAAPEEAAALFVGLNIVIICSIDGPAVQSYAIMHHYYFFTTP